MCDIESFTDFINEEIEAGRNKVARLRSGACEKKRPGWACISAWFLAFKKITSGGQSQMLGQQTQVQVVERSFGSEGQIANMA